MKTDLVKTVSPQNVPQYGYKVLGETLSGNVIIVKCDESYVAA